jgi:hypothetical protein
MKAGIIGADGLRFKIARGLRLELLIEPLRLVCSTSVRRTSILAGMSGVGDTEGEVVGGVYSMEVTFGLDLEEVLVADSLLPSFVVMSSNLHSGATIMQQR